MRATFALLSILLLSGMAAVCAADGTPAQRDLLSSEKGLVELPRGQYDRLINASRQPAVEERPAPAPFALGKAKVEISVDHSGSRPAARVTVLLPVTVYEKQWILVPLLPPATAVESASAAGSPLQLLATGDGMAWSVRKPGTYEVKLVLRVDATLSAAGYSLAVPLPRASSSQLIAEVPGNGLDIAVIPAVGSRLSNRGGSTRVEATLPATRGVQISWARPRGQRGFTLSRARYQGRLSDRDGRADDAVRFTAELDVELYDNDVTLPLLPTGVALASITIDGTEVPILVQDGHFAVLARGRGNHRIKLGFEAAVQRGEGPPRLDLRLPPVPVSRFELTLPGDKEVTVAPAGSVRRRHQGDTTVATVQVPMSEQISFSWTDAVPANSDATAQLNASLFHILHAEEGVLYGHALVRFEVRRGSTAVLHLALPAGVQIDQVSGAGGAVADWRIEDGDDKQRRLNIYLDHRLDHELLLDLTYDLSLPRQGPFVAPLFTALEVERQRGMVALLSSKDLTLEPQAEVEATRVGENLLPAFVRDQLQKTVAHTFKYADMAPRMSLTTAVPERQEGRFDARVDTLISLGEVALEGAASIAIEVKSGRLDKLELELPAAVHLFNLSAPSLRHYEFAKASEDSSAPRRLAVEFTQEMEGEFRLELSYEQVLAEAKVSADPSGLDSANSSPDNGLLVPLVTVLGAEIEQGRLALEALSAVEVRPAASQGLSVLDIAELPRQLLLRTTNPILQAYKYVRAEPRPELRLAITRHRLLEVQEATIDQADYRTLYTRDGLAVTTARFTVRNSRKQFLRLRLPPGSRVWSVSVDGQPEKPAARDGENPEEVLIKILHSTRGFPVEVIFGTRYDRLGRRGSISGSLPFPDILVTRSRWQVLLPDTLHYREPSTNMDLLAGPQVVTAEDLRDSMEELARGAAQNLDALRLSVPNSGLRYTFDKLYANQGAEAGSGEASSRRGGWLGRSPNSAWFEIRYSRSESGTLGTQLSILGALLLWLSVGWWALADREKRHPAGCALLGLALLGVSLGPLAGTPGPALAGSALALAAAGYIAYRRRAIEDREDREE